MVKQTTLTTTDTSITWTLTGSGYPSTDTVMNFGADDDNSGDGGKTSKPSRKRGGRKSSSNNKSN